MTAVNNDQTPDISQNPSSLGQSVRAHTHPIHPTSTSAFSCSPSSWECERLSLITLNHKSISTWPRMPQLWWLTAAAEVRIWIILSDGSVVTICKRWRLNYQLPLSDKQRLAGSEWLSWETWHNDWSHNHLSTAFFYFFIFFIVIIIWQILLKCVLKNHFPLWKH